MTKSFKRWIKKLESSRKPQNGDTRWLEIHREQRLKSLREAMERAGIKPISKDDYTNNEGVMDLKLLLKAKRRLEEDEEKKS